MVPMETGLSWMRTNIPRMAHDTPGGVDAIRALLPAEYDRAVGPLEPREPETLWWGEITYHQAGLPPHSGTHPRVAVSWTPTQSRHWRRRCPAARSLLPSL